MNVHPAFLPAETTKVYRLDTSGHNYEIKARITNELNLEVKKLCDYYCRGLGDVRVQLSTALCEILLNGISFELYSKMKPGSSEDLHGRNIIFRFIDVSVDSYGEDQPCEIQVPNSLIEKTKVLLLVDPETGGKYVPIIGDNSRDFRRITLPLTEETIKNIGGETGKKLLQVFYGQIKANGSATSQPQEKVSNPDWSMMMGHMNDGPTSLEPQLPVERKHHKVSRTRGNPPYGSFRDGQRKRTMLEKPSLQ